MGLKGTRVCRGSFPSYGNPRELPRCHIETPRQVNIRCENSIFTAGATFIHMSGKPGQLLPVLNLIGGAGRNLSEKAVFHCLPHIFPILGLSQRAIGRIGISLHISPGDSGCLAEFSAIQRPGSSPCSKAGIFYPFGPGIRRLGLIIKAMGNASVHTDTGYTSDSLSRPASGDCPRIIAALYHLSAQNRAAGNAANSAAAGNISTVITVAHSYGAAVR